jgi:serine/threonine protein kinase
VTFQIIHLQIPLVGIIIIIIIINYVSTPFQMAPEILTKAKFYDEKVDIWSLGTIYYQLLTKKKPFDAQNLIELRSFEIYVFIFI